MKSAVLGALLLFLSGCAVFGYEHRSVNPPISLYVIDPGSVLLQVCFRSEGRGNVHNPVSFEKWTYERDEWFVLPRDNGIASNEEIEFKYEVDSNSRLSMTIRGTIALEQDFVTLNIERTYMQDDGTLAEWRPYDLNGRYPLSRPSNKPLHTDTACGRASERRR